MFAFAFRYLVDRSNRFRSGVLFSRAGRGGPAGLETFELPEMSVSEGLAKAEWLGIEIKISVATEQCPNWCNQLLRFLISVKIVNHDLHSFMKRPPATWKNTKNTARGHSDLLYRCQIK